MPLGVVLCIPPFNYPVNLAVSKIGPALMAGNTVVVKPPTQGAVSALQMVQVRNSVTLHQCACLQGLPPFQKLSTVLWLIPYNCNKDRCIRLQAFHGHQVDVRDCHDPASLIASQSIEDT